MIFSELAVKISRFRLKIHPFQVTLIRIGKTAEQAGTDNPPHFIKSHVDQEWIKAVRANQTGNQIDTLLPVSNLLA